MIDPLTRFGAIEKIRIHRMEQTFMRYSVFDRYERLRRDVDAAVGQLLINGVSTCKFRGISKQLHGQEVGQQTLS